MSEDSLYIANYLQIENSTMSTEIEHLRKEGARLLVQLDEAQEMCRRLANALDLWLNQNIEEAVVRGVLDDYFSSSKKEGQQSHDQLG
jgi:hypothetical protein